MPHALVSDLHRNRAKALRQSMTRSETLFIKAHRIDGLGFRRQVPIGPYIVDFACHSSRLIIELDGETHDFDLSRERDEKRDDGLRKIGYRVLRFTNDNVMTSLEGVVQLIREAVQDIPPSLTLPHKGGGNSAGPVATGADT